MQISHFNSNKLDKKSFKRLCSTNSILQYKLLPATRKMCVVLQNVAFFSSNAILARGLLRTPLHPPAMVHSAPSHCTKEHKDLQSPLRKLQSPSHQCQCITLHPPLSAPIDRRAFIALWNLDNSFVDEDPVIFLPLNLSHCFISGSSTSSTLMCYRIL